MRARETRGRHLSVPACLLGLLAVLAGPGCTSSTPSPRQNLDPLYHGASGAGEYEVDPAMAALARRGPARTPEKPPPAAEKPCEHVYEQVDTHPYLDPETGMPSMCVVSRCVRCGRVVHDCNRRWAR